MTQFDTQLYPITVDDILMAEALAQTGTDMPADQWDWIQAVRAWQDSWQYWENVQTGEIRAVRLDPDGTPLEVSIPIPRRHAIIGDAPFWVTETQPPREIISQPDQWLAFQGWDAPEGAIQR